MDMEKNLKYGGKQVTIGIRNPCNYNCFYCVGKGHKQTLEIFKLERIRHNYERINGFTLTAFECGTGEPTLHPQIKELLELILQYGQVNSFPTNLSFHPKHWLPKKNQKNMTVLAALHPENENHINRFLEHILYLKENDVSTTVSFVCHPKRWYKKNFYRAFFEKYDIPVTFEPYLGTYKNIKYPNGYSLIQRKELGLENHQNWCMDLGFEATWRNFKTIPCLAGFIDIYINPHGQLFRCLYDLKPIKKVYSQAKPCRVGYCGCGFLLEELNNRNPEYWTPWKNKIGLTKLPDRKIAYEIDLDEKRSIYRRLKKKYEEKCQFLEPSSLGDLDGISNAMKILFSRNEEIDFLGIGLFFNSLITNKNFKEELIGNLFDNAIAKQGTVVLGRTIKPLKGFPKSKLSKNILLSVQNPEDIWDVDLNWIKNESIKVYFLVADADNKYNLTRIM